MALTSHANVAGNVADKANLAGYVQVMCANVAGNRVEASNVVENYFVYTRSSTANVAGNVQE